MNAPKSKFVRYYPMPNGITLCLTMLYGKDTKNRILTLQYGPETATKEQLFALSRTPELSAALMQFSDAYGEYLQQHFPDDLAGARA
jgi:hypothetical protein